MRALLLGGELGAPGRLEWTSETWLITAAVALALLAWGVAMVGRRPWLARLAEQGCWALALAGLVVALSGPVWVEEEGRLEPGRSVVLVDASRSMGVLEDDTPRSAAVPAILDHVRAGVGEVDVYHFGDDLAVGTPSAYDLPGTDLEGALAALSERVAGERLQSLVVVTDGLDRGPLRHRYRDDPAARAPELPGPLTVYQVGTPGEVMDVAVRSVDAGGFAFIRSSFRIAAQIDGIGPCPQSIPVTLEMDGAAVTTQTVRLDADGRADVTFEVVPEDAGRFTYAVRVPVYEGDAVPANNSMPVVVKVVRDRIRVLQVAGAPSWDVKFLRRFLKGDPSVQLVSFFILRTQRDLMTSYDDRELSLIQFPYERLFDEDLWTFDVVVFQNFDYEPYFHVRSSRLLGNLARYVEEGGALVMVGGDRSFGLGRYGGTALGDVLPVRIDSAEQPDTLRFQPQLTDVGARHPVSRLVGDPAENELWWSRLHPLDGTNVVLGPTEDAAVLLAHPSRRSATGEPLPVLAVREVGAGRTMALTVDSSWRWSLSEAAEGRGNQAYLRFWKNAIRWLMQDSTVARVTVDTPRENYAVDDEVRMVVRARDPGFAPLPGARVVATVTSGAHTSTLEGRTDGDGKVVLVVPASRRGTHRVEVEATHDGAVVGTSGTVYAVTTRDPETDEVAPDEAFLSWLAGRTGGQRYSAGELGPVVRDPGAGREVHDRRETPLWRAPALALWVCLLAGVAWIIRRRAGLR